MRNPQPTIILSGENLPIFVDDILVKRSQKFYQGPSRDGKLSNVAG